jgi:phage terminase large subunit
MVEKRRVITITGQDLPNLKRGAIRDFDNILNSHPMLKAQVREYNRSEYVVRFYSGSIIEFPTYSNAQDAKNGKRDYLFINEANGVDYTIFEELDIRTTKQIFIDYNPTTRFWAHEKLFGAKGVEVYRSTFMDNQYCDESIREKLLSYKTTNPARWRVYGLGLTGKIEGLIFKNYSLCDEFPAGAKNVVFGQDYGFTVDPTTMIRVGMHNGALYLDEMLYSTGLTNRDIVAQMELLGVSKYDWIIGDSAEPKTISDIHREGYTIEGATKGADSIKHGLNLMMEQPIFVTKRSVHLINELDSYAWRRTRDGVYINEPEDKFNHCIDAARYATVKMKSIREVSFEKW